MSFGHPILLVALVAVPLALGAWLLLERRRGRQAATWSTPSLLPNMVGRGPGPRRYVPIAFFLVGLALLLVGFARPRATLSEPREGATVVLAVDVSGSMAATDVKPTRLAAADAAISQFLKILPAKYRAALVTFSNRATVRVPPTYDRQLLLRALPAKAELEGTALGDAAKAAAEVASKAVGKSKPGAPHPPAAVLLLSDGNQNTGQLTPQQGATDARKLDVPISTVSLGTPYGVVYQKLPGDKGYPQRQTVPVANGDLRAVAQGSGGRFFQARSASQLSQVYKDLGHRLTHQEKTREISSWTTMGAAGFVVVGALLSGLWFRRLV